MDNMKKRFGSALSVLMIMAAFVLVSTACSSSKADDEIISKSALPQSAQKVLDTYFSGEKISRVVRDSSSSGRVEYEVDFVSGRDIEFNSKGAWESIDCKGSKVPAGLVPQAIRNYVANNAPGLYIVTIDRDRQGYEIELNNGVEMVFDSKGVYRYTERDD